MHKVGNVSIFAHMSNTLSLTNVDADITDKYYDSSKDAGDHKSYGKNLDAYRLHVKDFKVENATNLLNTICVYTCNKKAEVTLFSSLAKATQKNVYHVMSTYGLEVSKGRPMAAEKKLFHWSPIEKKFQITKPDGSTIQNLRAPKDAR